MELGKIFDQYVSSYQRWIKSVIRLGNNEVLKTLTKTLTFKFYVCDLDHKVMVMSVDGADKNVLTSIYHDTKWELNPSFGLEVMRS